jgi:hypothetical protein
LTLRREEYLKLNASLSNYSSPVSYLAFVALMFANFFGLKDVALPIQVTGIMMVAAG